MITQEKLQEIRERWELEREDYWDYIASMVHAVIGVRYAVDGVSAESVDAVLRAPRDIQALLAAVEGFQSSMEVWNGIIGEGFEKACTALLEAGSPEQVRSALVQLEDCIASAIDELDYEIHEGGLRDH